MKKQRRILAAVTALCMCAVSMPVTELCPLSVQAESSAEDLISDAGVAKAVTDTIPPASSEEPATEEGISGTAVTGSLGKIVADGTCGENLTWALNEEGTLTISGTGKMQDFREGAPWYQSREEIKKVVIQDGVTSIGNNAFYSCSNLTSVTIPNSVTSISPYAFNQCSSLASVTIPDGVTSIGEWTFNACSSLTSITIPDSVASIGAYAFCACSSLTSVTLPNSVASIGRCAFDGCTSLKTITFNNSKCVIPDSGNTIFNTATIYGYTGSTAQAYAEEYNRTFVSMNSSTCGENLAWNFKKSTGTLTISGTGAMYDFSDPNQVPWHDFCDEIKKLVLQKGITAIGDNAFAQCQILSETEIPDGVTRIGSNAFGFHPNVKSVTFPESVSVIGKDAFASCYFYNITVENPDCDIYDSKNTLGFNSEAVVFGYADSTAQLYAKNDGKDFIEIPNRMSGTFGESINWKFNEETGTLIISGTGMMKSANKGYSASWSHLSNKVKNVSIDEGVTNIGSWAFYGFSNIDSVTVPKNVSKIESSAFLLCSSLTSVTIQNPDCEIYDAVGTIPDTATIYGYADSTAQAYAEKYSRSFELIITEENSVSMAVGGTETYFCKADVTDINIIDKSVVSVTTTPSSTMFGVPVQATATISGLKNGTTDIYFTLANGEVYLFHVTVGTGQEAVTEPVTEPPTEKETESGGQSYSNNRTTTDFIPGGDNWSFANTRSNFGNKYYLKDNYYKKLMSGLDNVEKEIIYDAVRKQTWNGSCYGMAVTSILASNGILNPADYEENAAFLHDIPEASLEVKSLINYYFMLQQTNVISSLTRQAQYEEESEKLQKLISCLKDDSPTLLSFVGNFYGSSRNYGGHAVVAYGIDYGTYSFENHAYNGRILIYDNVRIDYDETYCLYFNSHNWSWYIPHYQLGSDTGAKFGMITDDLNLLNYHGFLGNSTASPELPEYIAQLNSNTLSDKYELHKVSYSNGNWMNAAVGEDDIRSFASLTDDAGNSDMLFALKDTESGYTMRRTDEPGLLELSLEYENSLLNVTAGNAKEAYFSPEGCAAVEGENTDYEIQIVLNQNELVTDWYSFTVSGKDADSAELKKSEGGYILTASNLKNITASAYNDDISAELTFSADYDSVLLYQVDEDTIGVKADTDSNGSYETLIAQTSLIPGDVTRSGKVDILDVIQLNKAILGKETLTANQLKLADVNKNQIPDASDSLMLMKYIVGLLPSLA